MDFLSSMFDPKNFAGVTGLLNRMGPVMSLQPQQQPAAFGLGGPAAPAMLPQSADQPSPLDSAQWPYGPTGAPSDANARLPENAAPTSGIAPMGLVPPSLDGPMNFLGGVRDKINDNSNMLLGLAAGIAGGRNWGDGISKGLSLAMQGGQLDTRQGSSNRTQQFLLSKGMDPEMARTVASNPTLLRSVLPKLMGAGVGGTKYGLNPIYGTDESGNRVLGVLGEDGTFKKVDTGGVTPQSGIEKIDMGTSWQLRDRKDGRVVGVVPKDVAGEAAAKKGGALSAERAAELPQARAALGSAYNNLDRLKSEAESVMNDPALSRITGMMGVLPNIPGSAASNVQARLETLKSQVGFSVLQAMRDASKTGGALGNVSNVENVMLQNNLAALSQAQDMPSFQRALRQIVQYVDDAKGRLGNAFKETYPGQDVGSPAAARADSGQPTPAPQSSSGARAAADGVTATNPQTGERMIRRNGKWEPLT